MKIKYLILLIFSLFLLSGCPTSDSSIKKDGKKKIPPKIYRLDLDADRVKEIVKIEDRFEEKQDFWVEFFLPLEKKEISFVMPGRFTDLEFIELNENGPKQMAIYYEDKDRLSNLVIFELRNNRLVKIFAAIGCCGIETDFSSVLARIKVGKSPSGSKDCFWGDASHWEVWVWQGEKFIHY